MSMTTHQVSVIDTTGFSVRRTIRIGAPIEKVWSAVTEPAHISRWFGQTVLDGRDVGALGTMGWPGQPTIPLRIEAIDAPHSISYRWGNDDAAGQQATEIDDEHSTVFTFSLVAVAGGTQLTVVETGFETTSDPIANLESHRGGWDSELDKLIAMLETTS